MFIILSIYSKNLISLTTFLKFLYKLKTNKILGLKFYTTQSQKKKRKSFFSVLQSPHVNKKSQEQFEYSLRCKTLKIYVPCLTRFLVILKRIQTTLFLDVRIEIKCWLENKPSKPYLLSKADSDKFRLKLLTKNRKDLFSKAACVSLKLLDIHGEILIKNFPIKSG